MAAMQIRYLWAFPPSLENDMRGEDDGGGKKKSAFSHIFATFARARLSHARIPGLWLRNWYTETSAARSDIISTIRHPWSLLATYETGLVQHVPQLSEGGLI